MKQFRVETVLERVRRLVRRPRGDPNRGSRSGGDDRLLSDGGATADAHLDDVPDGAGCTEIWEHLSDRSLSEGAADD